MNAAPIRVITAPDGAGREYLVAFDATELPAVATGDLRAAWDIAGDAARRRIEGGEKVFCFQAKDSTSLRVEVLDADARCWAAAIDRSVGIQTAYSLSVCLRLLLLIDLLGRASWAADLVAVGKHGIEVLPALLRLAAETTLTEQARFDEPSLAARLPRSAGRSTALRGARP